METDTAERYAAHRALALLGARGQRRLRESRVLLVGLGGLGCPAAQYLAAAGVGHLVLCDFDRVSLGNLNRQILFTPADVGRLKVAVAAEALAALNPDVQVEPLAERATVDALRPRLDGVALVLDASDNFATRLAVNEACLAARIPWVMGAAIRSEGQLAVFRPDRAGEPCYRCVYGAAPEALEDCAGAGILGPVAGVIGAAMATQALVLLGGGEPVQGLQLLDGVPWQWQCVKTSVDPACEACARCHDRGTRDA